MGLDLSKLENVKEVGGKITARCPACAATGGDGKGEHLVVYPDGRYGCVVNPEDAAHRKEIFALVGAKSAANDRERITVQTLKIPESYVIMDLGRFGRFSKESVVKPSPSESTQDSVAPVAAPPPTGEERIRKRRTPPLRIARPYLADSNDGTFVEHSVAMARPNDYGRRDSSPEGIRKFLGLN